MAENEGGGGSPAAAAADITSTSAPNTARSRAELSTERRADDSLEKDTKVDDGRSRSEGGDDEQGESTLEEGEGEDDEEVEKEEGEEEEEEEQDKAKEKAPPLPDEDVPPLPDEAPPGQVVEHGDDGWEPVWDGNAQAYYFYNRITGVSQWENPRVPAESTAATATAPAPAAPGVADGEERQVPAGRYNPAIHGDYDPTAPYAQQYEQDAQIQAGGAAAGGDYTATGTFNRFTGKWQDATLAPENFNDENKSRRQMHAYFDVDAAANSHDGRSLKAERSGKKLTKAEVKAFREKRRERKEEKRRAWLRD